MPNHPAVVDVTQSPSSPSQAEKWIFWASIVVSVAAVIWFYAWVPRFSASRSVSAAGWIWSSWNDETDYEHGKLFPIVIVGLIIYKLKDLKAAAGKGSAIGLWVIFIGILLYIASYRTLQPRIAFAGLPFILWGAVYYLWGWKLARILLFPLFFFWLAVPIPSFQQWTTHLQLLATSLAHHGSSLFGVETYVEGTTVLPLKGNWKPLDIAKGCSGIRSLMALLMISAAWAYIAKMALWKRLVLFLCAFPLAILGNSLRVISIFVIAEYGDAKWASGTWHDWSGLLLFYPISLILLLIIHALLEGGSPWKKYQKRTLKRSVVVAEDKPQTSITGL
jgi:exosortase